MKDENQEWQTTPFVIILSYSSLILHPSSFLSVSAKKLSYVWVFSLAQRFIGAAKNNLAVLHHHYFAIDQAKPFALPLKHHLSLFVYNRILRTQIVEVVHFVGDEY